MFHCIPPCSRNSQLKQFTFAIILATLVFINFLSTPIFAGDPEYFNPQASKPFVFAIGAGYGISNNPVANNEGEKYSQGISLSGSIGYHIGKRFKIDFGPVVWINGKDLFQNELPSGERTTNKTMLVSFNGYYRLHKKFPLSIKIGGGIGSLVYSPDKSTVNIDGKKNRQTEYYSGLAGTGSLIYCLKLSDKITLHPSLNFWYTDLKKQQIEYESAIDHRIPSITSDFRILMHVNF